ncbi:MAG: zinc ribbon domain-containing protein, partial [Myxococcota bacterium]
MTVFCPNCGTKNTDEATHCTSCGTELRKPEGRQKKFKGTMMMSGLGTQQPPGAPGGSPPAEAPPKKDLAFQATMLGPMSSPADPGAAPPAGFGQPPAAQPTSPSTGGFGQPAPGLAPGGFGQPTPATTDAPSTGGFGSPDPTPQPGGYGQAGPGGFAPPPQAGQGGGFGQPPGG